MPPRRARCPRGEHFRRTCCHDRRSVRGCRCRSRSRAGRRSARDRRAAARPGRSRRAGDPEAHTAPSARRRTGGSAADLAEVDDARILAASREYVGRVEVAVREHGGASSITPPERRHGTGAADESGALDRDRADQRQVAPGRDHGGGRRALRRDRPPGHRRRHHEGAAQQPIVVHRDDLGHRGAQAAQLAVHPGLRGHRLAILLCETQEQHVRSAAKPVHLGRSAGAHPPHSGRATAGQQPAGDLADGGDPAQLGPVCYAR